MCAMFRHSSRNLHIFLQKYVLGMQQSWSCVQPLEFHFSQGKLCGECRRRLTTGPAWLGQLEVAGSIVRLFKINRTLVFSRASASSNKKETAEVTAKGQQPADLAAPAAADNTKAPPPKDGKILKVTPRKKPIDYSYTANVFLLPVRAMKEYLLKPDDLACLSKYSRRSPYEKGVPITMYLRSDVEKEALKKWGSLENLNTEKLKKRRQEIENFGKFDLFQMGIPKEVHAYLSGRGEDQQDLFGDTQEMQQEQGQQTQKLWTSGTGKVVLSAIIINFLNTAVKFIAWLYTGSYSMFSECIHSLSDTLNQVILGVGLYHSIKKPDADHPYGYQNLKHIASLISGVGIFCFGTGLSVYHGIQGFLHPEPLESLVWGIATLVGTAVSEGATLLVAVNQVRKSSNAKNMTFWSYVKRGNDPNVNVVLLEDLAAVFGVGIAASCMAITQYTGNPFADSLGSILIGGILGGVASFIIYTNTEILVGKSIPLEKKILISQLLERDRMIRSLHDIKATEIGGQVRFKAEVDFDGREITRAFLYKMDLEALLSEMQSLKKVEDAENFMLNYGEKIIDVLGEEVDRIEKILKEKYPDLRHVDLEAL